ncbi:DUF6682 family protein [Comamonas sediminis]|uniref:phage adaptor protein n=1 Tax=Comamonas sediminis TaxID=1783360 RepID=UPI003D2A9AC4
MTLQDLIDSYRVQSGDNAGRLWCTDKDLTLYANEAQVEACRRGQLILQSSSTPLQAGDESLELASHVLRLTRANIEGSPVDTMMAADMDACHPGWQDDQIRSKPTVLISGVDTGQLYLWPRPDRAYTLRMTAQCLPLAKLVAMTDEPEIREELHFALVDWMLFRVYSHEDSQLFNPNKSREHEAKFIAEFGSKASGRNEEWVRSGVAAMPGPIA